MVVPGKTRPRKSEAVPPRLRDANGSRSDDLSGKSARRYLRSDQPNKPKESLPEAMRAEGFDDTEQGLV